MSEKKYIVEMTDDELAKFKKLLKEHKEKKPLDESLVGKKEEKKKMDEMLTTLAAFHVYKILSFKAAQTWAMGCKWSLSMNENMYNTYTKDYDYYIIHCGDTTSYAVLTNKNTYDVREIRNKRMERLTVDEFLEQFNGDNPRESKFTMESILKSAHPKTK